MTEHDLKDLLPSLSRFYSRFHQFFCRSEGRKWGEKYPQGLLLPIERKNMELETLIRKYSRRWLVEKSICEQNRVLSFKQDIFLNGAQG